MIVRRFTYGSLLTRRSIAFQAALVDDHAITLESDLELSASWSSIIAEHAQKGHLQEALELFCSMDLEGVQGTRLAYHTVLSVCGKLANADLGRFVHEEIADAGLEDQVTVGTAIIDMYGKCRRMDCAVEVFDRMTVRNVITWSSLVSAYALNGQLLEAELCFERMAERNAVSWTVMFRAYAEAGRMHEAYDVFSSMPERTSVSWNAMLSAFAQNGYPREAVKLLKEMDSEGIEINTITFVSVIDACVSLQDLNFGEMMQEEVSHAGLDSNTVVSGAFINLYGKCGKLDAACGIFRRVSSCNIRVYNTMLAAYTQNNHVEEAQLVFNFMPKWNVVSWNTLLSGYINAADIDCAREIFQSMKHRNTISWSSMVRAYAQCGHTSDSLRLFLRMDSEGVQPDAVTMMGALEACAAAPQQNQLTGRLIHNEIVELGMDSEAGIGSLLICMYGKFGDCEAAARVFDEMRQQDLQASSALVTVYAQNGYLEQAHLLFRGLKVKDVVVWNSLIAAFSQYWRVRDSVKLFLEMDMEGVVKDRITYMTILHACASVGMKKKGELIASCIREQGVPENDVELQVAVLNLYAKCGNLEDAQEIFNRFKEFNLAASSAMVACLARKGDLAEAKAMFDEMHQHDYIAWKVMIVGFCINGEEDEATEMLYVMPQWKIGCWNAVIEGYAHSNVLWEGGYTQNQHIRKGFVLFQFMDLEGIAPDKFTFINVLGVCGRLVDSTEGRRVHSMLVECGLETDPGVAPALITMYGNHGCLREAERVFDKTLKNASSWAAIVAAYTHNGESVRAVELFREMQIQGVNLARLQGVNLTRSAFTTILSACSHAGLFEEGLELSGLVREEYGMDLDLYVSVIDLLGRVGQLQEALELLECMPYHPNKVAWSAFLGACKTHGDSELGALAAMQMIQLQPNNGVGYAVLSNIYAGLECC